MTEDPRRIAPVSDARWTSGEDVQAHRFAQWDTKGDDDTADVEAHRFATYLSVDTATEGTDADVEAHGFAQWDAKGDTDGETPIHRP